VDDLIAELLRAGGRVPPQAPTRYATDFGRLVHCQPRAVVHVDREEQVAGLFTIARRRGLPVAIRGAGHSCYGQTLSPGIVLALDPDRAAPPRLVDEQCVEAHGGSRWRDVEAFLNARGRTVPVLADYLDLSVGGTLSVGGYGAESVAHGAQVDHVERLRLISPDGAARWCSPRDDHERFAFALAGSGRLGVIDRVVLRTIPFRPWTTLFTYHYSSLSALVDAIGWLETSPRQPHLLFKALHSGRRFVATYGVHSATLGEAAGALRRPPVARSAPARRWIVPRYRPWRNRAVKLWLARFPAHGRLWSDYLFDYEGLQAFTRFLQPLLDRDAFAGCLRSVYILAIRKLPRPVSFPMEASDSTRGPMSFGIGLYSMIPNADALVAERVAETVSRCLDACVALGGRPYRYGWHRMSEEMERAVYGPACDRLRAIRSEVDPVRQDPARP
jgi:FAD/FMN-containing dehydrogenase